MYSRNILIELSVFKAKYVGFDRYYDFLQLVNVFKEIFRNICITNDF